MEHKGTVLLESERLILRKFTLDDVEAMYHNWAKDERVTKFMTWPYHKNTDSTKMVIEFWMNDYNKLDYYQWAICLKETNEPIGSISTVFTNEKTSAIEIGYCIGYNYWNKGYTTEALKRLIEFFFLEVGANRISACHDVDNIASGKVMQKAGMKYEGTLRASGMTGEGKLSDLAYYSILRNEFK